VASILRTILLHRTSLARFLKQPTTSDGEGS